MVESENAHCQKTDISEMEAKAQQYAKRTGIFLNDRRLKCFKHTFLVACSNNF